jgi:hypothetical protein
MVLRCQIALINANCPIEDTVVSHVELPHNPVQFDLWTPPIPEPSGAVRNGVYMDQVYF